MIATTDAVNILEAAQFRPLTVKQFMRMAEAGILSEDERVELIDGVLVKMSPINPRHATVVDELGTTMTRALPNIARVRIQGPIKLSAHSMPQPDIVVMRALGEVYNRRHPEPEEIFLLVEVSDSTLRYDRDIKLPRYARAGIREAWILDLVNRQLLVFRQSQGDACAERLVFGPGDTVAPLAFPELRIEVASLLPEEA